ncbi:MAG: GNAT family protein [Candidatus Zixiibacteriota bacterium]
MMAEKKATPPTAPSLVGEKIYLRAATADDIANTHHWFLLSEPQTQTCRPVVVYSAAEASENFKKDERTPFRQQFMVIRTADNVPVGRVSYFDLNPLNRSAELGLLVDPEERRKGFGREAIRILSRYLFRYRGLNKVYAQTSQPNIAACKLLEAAGFRRDGTLRHHYFINNEFHDGYLYSLLLFEFDG